MHLFTLTARNAEARRIIETNIDRPYVEIDSRGLGRIHCYADSPSRIPDRLLSFGADSAHDIRLQFYTVYYCPDHFHFFLASSGELLLEDSTRGLTEVASEGLNLISSSKSRHELRGYRSQRVIPRTDRFTTITVGTVAVFTLHWIYGDVSNPDGFNFEQQCQLAIIARRIRPSLISEDKIKVDVKPTPLPPHLPPPVSSFDRTMHRYRLLGKGSFGKVWKSVDIDTGELWAVKEVKYLWVNDRPEKYNTFFQELGMLRRIQHASIVQLVGWQDVKIGGRCQLFFTMYKGNLAELIPRYTGPREAFGTGEFPDYYDTLVKQMIAALDYLHRNSIVHRDIKPQNIMYGPGEFLETNGTLRFYLGDFGISTAVELIDRNNPGPGSTFFMAPELARNSLHPMASDVWALGVTFGCVLQYWHHDELGHNVNYWAQRFQCLGFNEDHTQRPSNEVELGYFLSRISQHAAVPVALKEMMKYEASFRPTVGTLAENMSSFRAIGVSR